jgi:hypothetical protein
LLRMRAIPAASASSMEFIFEKKNNILINANIFQFWFKKLILPIYNFSQFIFNILKYIRIKESIMCT